MVCFSYLPCLRGTGTDRRVRVVARLFPPPLRGTGRNCGGIGAFVIRHFGAEPDQEVGQFRGVDEDVARGRQGLTFAPAQRRCQGS